MTVAARACVIGPLAVVAGCATNKPSYVAGPSQQMAAAHPPKVEMEDDGQPVQPPPARAFRPEEDDPSQPWSPNYGKGVSPAVPSRAPNPKLPKQVDAAVTPMPQPVALRSTGSLTSMTETAADAVVMQAINAHEMRAR